VINAYGLGMPYIAVFILIMRVVGLFLIWLLVIILGIMKTAL
jgi:hypothetical protein